MSEKKNNKALIIRALCLSFVVVVICIVIWLLTHQREEKYEVSNKEVNTSSLECKSTEPKDPFFSHQAAQRNEHVLKLIFKDDKLDQISYDYLSVYNSESTASGASADLHTKLYRFMDSVGLSNVVLNPNLAPIKSKLRITLHWDLEKVSGVVSPIFFMTNEEYNSLNRSGNSEVKKMYEEKGFSCIAVD